MELRPSTFCSSFMYSCKTVGVTEDGGFFFSSLSDFRLQKDRSIGHSSTVLLGKLREVADEVMAT